MFPVITSQMHVQYQVLKQYNEYPRNITRVTRWYVRVLSHHTANGCHGAKAICCILNWNVFVLKHKNIINHSNFLSFPICPQQQTIRKASLKKAETNSFIL